jgi:hypothetical protein
MPNSTWLSVPLITFALFGCGVGDGSQNDAALVTAIEKQMRDQHPEFDLRHYTRIYTRDDIGNVDATYILKSTGGLPSKWKSGRAIWANPGDEIPEVSDGGCGVIRLRYNVPSQFLVSVSCNPDA